MVVLGGRSIYEQVLLKHEEAPNVEETAGAIDTWTHGIRGEVVKDAAATLPLQMHQPTKGLGRSAAH
jgi:hypothetical protein